jgi:hypothetical protein
MGVGRLSKNMINLPTIQIPIYIKETLSKYYQKVKGKSYDIADILDLEIDIHNCCPICGGVGCVRFIGYYYRKMIDEKGTYYKKVPIARYICRGKGGQKIVGHKTFSLLPYQLVPYIRYSIPFIINSLETRYREDLSLSKLQDYLAQFGKDDILPISADQLLFIKNIAMEAVQKIMATGYYKEFEAQGFCSSSDKELLIAFIGFAQNFECGKIDPSIRGPCGLHYDFYLNGGGFYHNAHFLFGTASQFRKNI